MIKINPNIFRTYDIRGIYPDDLNEEVVRKIVLAFSYFYPQAKKIVVAHDSRLSSPFLSKAIKETLVGNGKEVIDIGISPDPLFYFSIFHYQLDGGIMVSGSHNPKEYNGLTLHIRKPGKEISEDLIKEDLEKIKKEVMKERKIRVLKGEGKVTPFNPTKDYINYVTAKISLKRPLKIIIDSGNGACGYLPEKVFKKLGCQVKTIYGQFDGNFPHHLPDPYQEENLKDVKEMILKEKADIGFAYDCDGDRIAIINRKGQTISGDFCLLILALQVLKKKKGPIVHDVRVSKAFLDEMEKRRVKTYFSVSHHSAIIEKILETGAVFGGEITLHFLFPLDYYLCDEAIFASLKLAEIVSEKKDFVQYVESLPRYFTSPEVFIETTDEKKFKIIENLQKYLRENNYDFIGVDGARINFPNGWALARAANTTPFIKCRFEGKTKRDLIEIEKKSLEIFKKVGIPVTKKTYQELSLKD
ncbi:MAG: phosphomannomutase/phosphoglucomutase [Patescibacteria group bacterium]|nr:phosphomannomutase/phosphoglucomutase [Patescibacteria group bacterium]